MATSFNIMVGGEAGQGVQSVGFVLAKSFSRAGWHVFADQDYESRIRGGHNFFRIRVSDEKVQAISGPVHVLVALNAETVDLHQSELDAAGMIILDPEKVEGNSIPPNTIQVPFDRIATEQGGDKLFASAVAAGSALALSNCPLEQLERVLVDQFGSSGDTVIEGNKVAARSGYELVRKSVPDSPIITVPIGQDLSYMLLHGNEALALGALAAGCKFVSGYPMTPATSIIEFFGNKSADYGLVVIQAEDEIAAVNMAIGASFAGIRAMTATSGGGFALMVEAMSLAGATETPLVVMEAQRAGPSTGLPTRTDQGDLDFVVHCGHGEFPRAVLAPGDVEEAFLMGAHAFNIADKYQVPVVLLTDQYLASSYVTALRFDVSKVSIDRGDIFVGSPNEYRRHRITDSGISPRAFPGGSEALVFTCGDEHDESGHIIEDAETRNQMVIKRMKKQSSLQLDVILPRSYGSSNADVTLVGWGSTLGPMMESVDVMRQQGLEANMLHFGQVWPFPTEVATGLLVGASRIAVVENNSMGQFARLLKRETGISAHEQVLRFDGRPFSVEFILDQLNL